VLLGDAGDDFLKGGTRRDTIRGGEDDDKLFGNSFDDLLEGGAGDDTLNGGGDDDTLIGGAGDDRMKGGAGADRFDFHVSYSAFSAVDEIVDFEVGVDTLLLDRWLFDPFGGLTAEDVVNTFGTSAYGDSALDFGFNGIIVLRGLETLDGVADDIVIV